jgi:hypothetical protein
MELITMGYGLRMGLNFRNSATPLMCFGHDFLCELTCMSKNVDQGCYNVFHGVHVIIVQYHFTNWLVLQGDILFALRKLEGVAVWRIRLHQMSKFS